MRKGTKIILILLVMALAVGCSSGCDGGESPPLDDETIHSLLHNPQGWVPQEDDYMVRGTLVANLLFIESSEEASTVIIKDAKGNQIDGGRLQKEEEGYVLICGLGKCSLKVSANSSKESIDLTLTNQDDNKYYFALNGDT